MAKQEQKTQHQKILFFVSLFHFFSYSSFFLAEDAQAQAPSQVQAAVQTKTRMRNNPTAELDDKEKSWLNNELIRDTNPETGIQDRSHFTADDSVRQTLQFNFKALTSAPADLLGAEYQFAKNFSLFWAEFFVSYTRTNFQTIGENHKNPTASTNTFAESANPRPDNALENILMLGVGPVGRYLFPDSLNFFNWQNLYQTTGASLTYLSLEDMHRHLTYQGWGLRAAYGIHKRLGTHNHLGAKFSYNMSIVKRGKEVQDEPQNERRLYLSWVAFALDYSFYF